MLALAVSFVIFLTLSSGEPTLPKLPNAFLVNVEANLIDQNKTENLREFYDFNIGWSKLEINYFDSFTHYYNDLNNKQTWIVVNGQTCEKKPITSSRNFNIRSTADLMVFGDQFNETYVGVEEIRGVPCDKWLTSFNFVDQGFVLPNGTLINNGTVYNFNLTYYFTVESWGFRSLNVTRKPMRAFLYGTKTTVNNVTTIINHYYEFVNFVPRAPLAETFALPTVCVGISDQVLTVLKSKAGAGLATGMFFLGLFIGIIGATLSIWVYCKRRQAQRDRFSRGMEKEDNL